MVTELQFRFHFAVFVSLKLFQKKVCVMKKICTLLVSALIGFSLHAQVASVQPNDAKSASTSAEVLDLLETSYDFGKIPQGKPVTHIFNIVNNGKDSLKITNVQASCGCTTPEWETGKVQAPGEKTHINIGYNAASEGQFLKSITVTYNDNQTKQITIKGEVWKTPLTSAPENSALKSLKEDQ